MHHLSLDLCPNHRHTQRNQPVSHFLLVIQQLAYTDGCLLIKFHWPFGSDTFSKMEVNKLFSQYFLGYFWWQFLGYCKRSLNFRFCHSRSAFVVDYALKKYFFAFNFDNRTFVVYFSLSRFSLRLIFKSDLKTQLC